ncbi:hypothetical protein O6H91_12G053200 [Diphasiastrum complanatum]|nr:hypothetical protein O6H91_12G053200 [Diphasiastrum complanatum]
MSKPQLLAFKAQFIQEKAMQKSCSEIAIGRKVEERQSEKSKVLQQLVEAKADVAEMKKRRAEDAKANAKVVAIFATQEHGWKIERKKLIQESELLKKQIDILHKQLESRAPEGKLICKNCKKRDTCIVNLKEQLGEKELELMVTIEEAKAEQIEKNEVINKLALAEVLSADLQERLAKEAEERESDFQKDQVLIIELRSKQQWMEKELQEALEKLEASNGQISEILSQKSKCEELVEEYREELAEYKEKMAVMMAEKSKLDALIKEYQPKSVKLQNDIVEKDEVISAMLNQANAEKGERHELSREIAQLTMQLRQTQTEKDRWKRIGTEWGYMNAQLELVKPIHCFEGGDAPEEDKLAEMQRLHDEKVRDVHVMYQTRIQELETQLRIYNEQLSQKENDILLQITEHESKYFKGDNIALNDVHRANNEIAQFDTSVEAEKARRKMQRSVARDLLIHNMQIKCDREIELEKWKKLYIASKSAVELLQMKNGESVLLAENAAFKDWVKTVKARQAAQLEEKHWHEIDSFTRQLRARDERIEAFRLQLLKMDEDLNEHKVERAILKSKLDHALEEKLKLHTRLQETTKELEKCKGEVSLVEIRGCNKAELEHTCHHDEREQADSSIESNVAKKGLQRKELKSDADFVKIPEVKSASSVWGEAKTTQNRRPKKSEIRFRPKTFARTFRKHEVLKYQLKDILVSEKDYGLGNALVNLKGEKNSEYFQPHRKLKKPYDLFVSYEEKSCTSEGSLIKMSSALLSSSDKGLKDQSRSPKHHDKQLQSETSFDFFNTSTSDSAENSPSFPDRNMKSRAKSKETIWGFLSKLRPAEDHGDLDSKIMQSMTNNNKKMELAIHGMTCLIAQDKHSSENSDGNTSRAAHTVGSNDTNQQTGSVHERYTETVLKLAKNMQKIEIELGHLEKLLSLKISYLTKGSTEIEDAGELCLTHLKRSLLKIIPALRRQSRGYQALLRMIGRLCKRVNLNYSLKLYSLPYSEAFPSILRLSLRETLDLQQNVNLAGQKLTMIQAQIEELSAACEEPEKIGLSIQKHLETLSASFKGVQHGLETKVFQLIANFEGASAHERRIQ